MDELTDEQRQHIRGYASWSGGFLPKVWADLIYLDPELREEFGLNKFEFTPKAKWLGNRYQLINNSMRYGSWVTPTTK